MMIEYKEDEIEVLGSNTSDAGLPVQQPHRKQPNRLRPKWPIVLIAILVLALLGYCTMQSRRPLPDDGTMISDSTMLRVTDDAVGEEGFFEMIENTEINMDGDSLMQNVSEETWLPDDPKVPGCVATTHIIDNDTIKLLFPFNAQPELHVGKLKLKDPKIVLALQAADIRRDNYKVVGTCVNKGRLIADGVTKLGFCAIVNNEIHIGKHENPVWFDRAMVEKGDFFRQYPLVTEGRVEDSNLESESVRRALCERQGVFFVAESQNNMTVTHFASLLVEMNVENAIYLVGSKYAVGAYQTPEKEFVEWGRSKLVNKKYVTYLVWKSKNK